MNHDALSDNAFDAHEAETLFPIPRSQRRLHAATFSCIGTPEALRDNETFYAGLSKVLSDPDLFVIRAYDFAIGKKSFEKSFFARSFRRLARYVEGPVSFAAVLALHPERFEEDVIAGKVWRLLKRYDAVGTAAAENGTDGSECDEAADEVREAAWRDLRDRLRAALAALETPDEARAEEILELADELFADTAYLVSIRDEQATRQQRGELAKRIERSAPSLGEVARRVACVPVASLPDIESALVAVEAAASVLEHQEKAEEARKAELNGAASAQNLDYGVLEGLLAAAKATANRVAEARLTLEKARQTLDRLLDTETLESALPAGAPPKDGTDAARTPLPPVPGTPSADGNETQEAPTTPAANSDDDMAAGTGEVSPEGTDREDPLPAAGLPEGSGDETEAPDRRPTSPTGRRGDDEAAAEPGPTANGHPGPTAGGEPAPARPPTDSEPSVRVNPVPPMNDAATGGPKKADLEARSRSALASWLERGEIGFAFELAACVERAGARPAVPKPVLEALALSPRFSAPEDLADRRTSETLAQMMAALAAESSRQDPDGASAAALLALAALLRPALFDMGNIVRSHVANLPMNGVLEDYAPLANALARLDYAVTVRAHDLASLVSDERKSATPDAAHALWAWREKAQKLKTKHQPTYRIFHSRLAPTNDIGRLIDAAIAGAADAEASVRAFVDRYADKRIAQEQYVAACEKESGRPRKDRIEFTALDWFCDRLQECCEHLREWLAAREEDRARVGMGDAQRDRLAVIVGALRKEIHELPEPDLAGSPLIGAALAVLRRAIVDFDALLVGRIDAREGSQPRSGIRRNLLRLPGGCQPHWLNDPSFAIEREVQQRRMLEALLDPDRVAPDLSTAFTLRLAEGALLSASECLDHLEERGDDVAERRQDLADAVRSRIAAARRRLDRLRPDLATLANLDLDPAQEVRKTLDKLAAIDEALDPETRGDVVIPAFSKVRSADVPPDFLELDDEMARFEALRDELRARIAAEQRERLRDLAQQGRPDADVILKRLEAFDPMTVDSWIADIRSGRPVDVAQEASKDDFHRFFPRFVEEAQDLRIGDVLRAIREQAQLGPLDFTEHDSSDNAAQLIEHWNAATNALREGDPRKLTSALKALFEIIGFTQVTLERDHELTPRKLRRMRLNADVLEGGRWFLPPTYGSEARGSYPVLIAGGDLQNDQLSTALGKEGAERPTILIVLAKLSCRRRSELAKLLRSNKQTALLVDASLVMFLAGARDRRMQILFTCATTFAWVQPYTTSAGNIPPEMFFGREDEIRKIRARESGGCLIYGGRQLGKSALLHHVRQLEHAPDRGQIAIYLEIRAIGDLATPTEELWQLLADELARFKVVGPDHKADREICTAIKEWIEAETDRRILVLLDEADNFLAAEHAGGYRNLDQLKTTMTETGWRFKVAFAGLHKVRRMAQAPNSPLPHLGHPICVGPMNQTADTYAELRRLATVPMRAAGFEYESPSLVEDMLTRVNHYPSLVQVFCKSVINNAINQPRSAAAGPRWTLGSESLFEGKAAETIAFEIRERFQWTLNLDPRYDLIAKRLALHRLDDADGNASVLRSGLTVEEVDALVRDWWPAGVPRGTLGDLTDILDEMYDLGVFGRFEANRYGLRNAYVAQMLGDREAIERDIEKLSLMEPPADYDPATFHRRVDPLNVDPRSPLPDRLIDIVADTGQPGLRVVMADEAVVGRNAVGLLEQLLERWRLGGRDFTQNTVVRAHAPAKAREALDRGPNGRAGTPPRILVFDFE